jgi:hypothetical protein
MTIAVLCLDMVDFNLFKYNKPDNLKNGNYIMVFRDSHIRGKVIDDYIITSSAYKGDRYEDIFFSMMRRFSKTKYLGEI